VNVVGGLVARKRMEEMDDAFWDQVMTLNTKSIFAMTQASLPLMTDVVQSSMSLRRQDAMAVDQEALHMEPRKALS